MGATDRSGIDSALHRLVIESATDPGQLGAGRGWLDTSAAPVLKIRNADDSGWNTVGAGGGGGDTWTLVEADAAGSPYTPVGGTNTWYRVNTTAGAVTINAANTPAEGDQIMVTPLDSVNPVNYPWTGEVLVGQTSLARYDAVHAFYAPVVWSDFLGRARGAGLTDSGTAIAVDIGTTAGKVLALDVDGKIPAVDASQLLNLPGALPVWYDESMTAFPDAAANTDGAPVVFTGFTRMLLLEDLWLKLNAADTSQVFTTVITVTFDDATTASFSFSSFQFVNTFGWSVIGPKSGNALTPNTRTINKSGHAITSVSVVTQSDTAASDRSVTVAVGGLVG